MKKIVLLMLVVCAGLTANAQVYVGGNVGFWDNDDTKFTNFTINPEIGYNFNEKWAVGAELIYMHNKNEGVKVNSFGIAPYARYNYFQSGMVRLFLDGGFGYLNAKPKGGESSDGFEIGIKPGIALDVTDKISLVSRFGFVGFRDDYGDGTGTSNGFGLGVLGQNLSLGIQVKF